MSYESPFFEVLVDDGKRRLTTARPNDMGGEITSWEVDSAFMTPSDAFWFEFIGELPDDRRGLEMAPVTLQLDGTQQLLGRIDITVRGDKGPSIVNCRGRDYISDLVEGDIDPDYVVKAGATLEDAILQACGPYGITEVEGEAARQEARTKRRTPGKRRSWKKQLQDNKPQPGQSAHNWCDRLLARQGLTMQPASRRNAVVLQFPNYSQEPIGTIRRTDTSSPGNVIRGVATRDFSKFPTFAMMPTRQGQTLERSIPSYTYVNCGGIEWASQFNMVRDTPEASGAATQNSAIVKVVSKLKNTWDMFSSVANCSAEIAEILTKNAIAGRRKPSKSGVIPGNALYRLLYWKDEHAKTQEQIDAAALRAVAERFKDTLRYEVTLRGFSDPDTGLYWATDTILNVFDDVADVHEPLWVSSRKFSFNGSSATTTLECWRPGSFQIGDPNA